MSGDIFIYPFLFFFFMGKKGIGYKLIFTMDVVGFSLILLGSLLTRYAKDEIFAILGGFVLGGGVTILALTRYITK